jgi:hypothetical protein
VNAAAPIAAAVASTTNVFAISPSSQYMTAIADEAASTIADGNFSWSPVRINFAFIFI